MCLHCTLSLHENCDPINGAYLHQSFFFSDAGLIFIQFCTEVQGDIRTSLYVPCKVYHLPATAHTLRKDSNNAGNFFLPYSSRKVCGSSWTPHIELINMEGIVRRGLRFIVLIQEEDLSGSTITPDIFWHVVRAIHVEIMSYCRINHQLNSPEINLPHVPSNT